MRALLHVVTLFIVCIVARGRESNNKLQCKDENNAPVDWYVLYKLPKVQTSSNPVIREGLAYLYITNVTIGAGWQLSTRTIASNNSIPGITLAPLYNRANENTTLWNLYNDSPPDAPYASTYGHTKGVAMVNSEQGFWLIHSVPNFPPVPKAGQQTRPLKKENLTVAGAYSYPETGTHYGQSFLCVSLAGDQFNVVGEQLMHNEIAVYGKNIPDGLAQLYPLFTNATNQRRFKTPPYTNKARITSLGSAEFTSFAKGGKWGKDLYADFVAPQLQSDLYVQSWLNGRGKLPSTCSGRKVYNVKTLVSEAANIDFTSSRDHSKWAISVNRRSADSWVCVGDINRADTQYSRGGGAVCLNDFRLWNNYRNVVNDIEPCQRNSGWFQ